MVKAKWSKPYEVKNIILKMLWTTMSNKGKASGRSRHWQYKMICNGGLAHFLKLQI